MFANRSLFGAVVVIGGVLTPMLFAGTLLAASPPILVAIKDTTSPASDPLAAIRAATEPTVAAKALDDALANQVDKGAAYDAYVKKMVELDYPELAYKEAQLLVAIQQDNGLAWGVIAYGNARRGEPIQAFSDLQVALQNSHDAFILRTAGQLVAWYDNQTSRTVVADKMKEEITQLRRGLSGQTAYALGYTRAMNAYAELMGRHPNPPPPAAEPVPATAPAEGYAKGQPASQPVDNSQFNPPPIYNIYNYDYSTQYASQPYDNGWGGPWWGTWWGGPWWGGGGVGFSTFRFNHFHFNDFDGDDHHGGHNGNFGFNQNANVAILSGGSSPKFIPSPTTGLLVPNQASQAGNTHAPLTGTPGMSTNQKTNGKVQMTGAVRTNRNTLGTSSVRTGTLRSNSLALSSLRSSGFSGRSATFSRSFSGGARSFTSGGMRSGGFRGGFSGGGGGMRGGGHR